MDKNSWNDTWGTIDWKEGSKKDVLTEVENLITAGADVNAKDKDGWTALMPAAGNGHPECVEKLIAHGADVNARSNNGWTALNWAADAGRTECVEKLIAHGADVNAKSEDGWTALIEAACCGYTECVEKLIAHGADVNAKNNFGWTAFDYTEKGEIKELLRNAEQIRSDYLKSHPQTPEKSDNSAEKERQTARQKKYGIEVSEEPMPLKEQIEFYIQNGMSFMLHGPSGVGKSCRVKEIDPDLTSITLCNGILPEDVIGKTIYPNGVGTDGALGGVWSPPNWYVELCKKCETEPNKKHVLFIDEVTNARETTQSLIYHVALEKSIAQGVGKLPDNAVVVLAGNSKEESGAAYNMPAPLFRRLSHIYLDLNIQEWLEWGSERSKHHPETPDRLNIHPLVASFVATYGQKVFYSEYDEEDPGKFALDPRKWEKVSDKIYANKGVMRREILEADIGPELAASLLSYAKNPPLSVEDILSGEYGSGDIPKSHDARLALTLSLRHATAKEVGKVREFIDTELGAENRAIFDSVWVGKDDTRALQLASLRNAGGR